MSEIVLGMSGGDAGANGLYRRLALAMTAGFLLIITFITIANAESMISDFAAAGVPETPRHIWIWQLSSVIAWLTVTPAIWVGVARLRPPRISWSMAAILFVAGVFVASAWHIGVMIALRSICYAIEGLRYHFEGEIGSPYVYEFRKDIGTYLQFSTLAMLCQWLLARACATTQLATIDRPDRFVAVSDGAVTHQVPVDDIVQIVAAGNYVEIERDGRSLLHRATLAMMESELGDRFVRIHRSRIVNRDAIRRIETNQSGDFEVVLSDGTVAKGSRRYRAGVEQRL